MVDLDARVAALSPAQRALLARRLHAFADVPEAPAARAAEMPAQLVAYYVPASDEVAAPAQLRAHLRERLPEYMVPAHFVPLRTLPRTPNGKIDQNALPDPALLSSQGAGDGAELAGDEQGSSIGGAVVLPASAVEEVLAQIWAEVLGFDTISVHDNFFEVGGDSILSIQIVARAGQAGLRLAPDDLFQYQTIAELARVVETRRPPAKRSGPGSSTRMSGRGTPLTPIQHWFFDLQLAEPQHWNQALLLSAQMPLQVQHLADALEVLVQRHDALRLCFRQTEQGWHQEVMPPGQPVQPLAGSYTLPQDDAARAAAMAELAANVQGGFDLASGCLLRAAHVQGGGRHEELLLLAVHHLAVDAIGLGVLVEELAQSYRQLAAGLPLQAPQPTASYQEWALALADYAGEERVRGELGFWSEMLATPTPLLPTDAPRPADLDEVNREATTERVTVAATADETLALLRQKAGMGGAQINDLLLTALALTICEWCGHDTILVGLEGHGREGAGAGIDASRSVGWFTAHYPLVLQLGSDRTPALALQRVREQLQRIPQRGIGYGVLRYLTAEGGRALAESGSSELLFNYLGQFDRSSRGWDFLAMAEGEAGPLRSPHNRRHHLLECNAVVLGGVLQLRWEYCSRLHQRATIERLAQRYLQHLRSLIAPGAASPVYTPEDFPEANLTQAELNDLLAGLDL